MKTRIRIETFPNPDARSYHTTKRISDHLVCSFRKPFEEYILEKYLEGIGRKGKKLLKELFALEELVRIYIEPYELVVTKNSFSCWEDVESGIFRAIEKVFGERIEDMDIVRDQHSLYRL